MAAISMKDLVVLEAKFGLEVDGLSYPQRLSRITKMQQGEPWEPSTKVEVKRGTIDPDQAGNKPHSQAHRHPLYGRRLFITPLIAPDKNRAIYFDEPIGPDIQVEEMSAGKMLYGAGEDVDRMVGDYKVISNNPNRTITAKTTLPKSGQEISWEIGKELVPVVRGNDGQRGYIWQMATHVRQFEDTMIQLYGLKTLITQVYPELLPKFSGKPVMMYIDGLVLAASIPQTDAIMKEHRRKELQDAKLGLV